MGKTRRDVKLKTIKNQWEKIKIILEVIKPGEKVTAKEITERIKKKGYSVEEKHIKMFIYYRMLHKYLKKEKKEGVNYYFLAR